MPCFKYIIAWLKTKDLHSFRVPDPSRMSGKDSSDEGALSDSKSEEEDSQLSDGSGEE